MHLRTPQPFHKGDFDLHDECFCDGKTSNVVSSPWRLSGPLPVVELGGPMDDKFDICAHEWNCHSNRPRTIRCAKLKARYYLYRQTIISVGYIKLDTSTILDSQIRVRNEYHNFILFFFEIMIFQYVTQCQLMRLFAVKVILSYEQKCKVRSKFLKNLSVLKNKLVYKFYEFINSN